MWVSLSLLALLVIKANATTKIDDTKYLDEKFIEFGITPTTVPTSPLYYLTVIYGEYRASLGNIIPVCATISRPVLSFPTQSSNYLYTLIFFDIDYPAVGANNGTQVVNGIVFNMPGADPEQGDPIVPYIGPRPIPGLGYNRFVYLIYRQTKRTPVTNEILISIAKTQYKNFVLSKFVEQYDLGNPVAGNFFRVRQTLCECLCEEETYCDCCDDDCSSQGQSTTYQCTKCDSCNVNVSN